MKKEEIQVSARNKKANHEYFILENRQQTSWDYYLPGHGMLIFHINRNAPGWNSNCSNCNPNNPGFDLEEAGGSGWYTQDSEKPFPGTGYNTSFTDETSPSSQSFNGTYLNRPIFNIAENTTTKNITFTLGQTPRPIVKTQSPIIKIDTVSVGVVIENLSSFNIVEAGINSNLDVTDLENFLQVANTREAYYQILDTMKDDNIVKVSNITTNSDNFEFTLNSYSTETTATITLTMTQGTLT